MGTTAKGTTRVIYEAQPGPQSALISCPIEDVFYGGARGGGKTYGLLGDWLSHSDLYGENARGIFFRRTYNELDEVQDRASRIFPAIGAKYQSGKRTWFFLNGSTLKLRHLDRDADADNYQGHAYCVAVGTSIVMADGSKKAIETVRVGEKVRTLEGARLVTATLKPYLTECVAAFVFDSSGSFVGVQVHPQHHPVLTTAGTLYEQSSRLSGSVSQFRQTKDAPCMQGEESHLETGQEIPAWLSFSGDDRSDYKVSEGESPESPQFPLWCDSLVLYGQSHPSEIGHSGSVPGESIEYCSLDRSIQELLDLYPDSPLKLSDRLPHRVLSQSVREIADQYFANARTCGQSGSREALDSQAGCPIGDGYRDERALALSGTGQSDTPQLADAEKPFRAAPLDALDTIPKRTRLSRPTKYLHPYSGEARNLSEGVQVGSVLLIPCGQFLVSDLTVADANHYITETSLINKNTWMSFDELGNWPSPKPIDKLRACLRSGDAPIPKSFRASGNPGGIGHNWVKARYIDPAPPFKPFFDAEAETWRVFIPSTLDDNPALLLNDPDYWKRVKASTAGDEALEKAWRWGDWDIVAGGMFDDLWRRDIHVIKPFSIPPSWTIDRSFDWGSSAPFSVGWWAESDGTKAPNGRHYPPGTLFRINEWYGWNERPNEGLKMLATEIAKGIKEREAEMGIAAKPGPADSSIFDAENGVCIADDMAKFGVKWTAADKSPGSRKTGWERIRKYLKACIPERDANGNPLPMEQPGLFVFEQCAQFIRTVPVLPRDQNKRDDVDTKAEDHCGDESRYRVMEIKRKPQEPAQSFSLNYNRR